jgi:signal transduction histidine kinase
VPVVVVALTLAVFGGAVGVVSWRLRGELRAQIVGREGEILHELALWQGLAEAAGATDGLGADLMGLEGGTGDPEVDAVFAADRLNAAVGRLKGVFAARLFDPEGRLLLATPPVVGDLKVATGDCEVLRQRRPVSRLWPRFRREDLFAGAAEALRDGPGEFPVLEVMVPLAGPGGGKALGVAQILLDGRGVVAECRRLDGLLWRQALGVYAIGVILIGLGLAWAFRRLERANGLLEERTAGLQRANEELALAAKTSAVGAVTAHLVHGLRNPLAGLQQYVGSLSEGQAAGGDPVWREAVESTRRMQRMLQEVMRVVRDEGGEAGYECSCEEVAQAAEARVRDAARAGGITVVRKVVGEGSLTNREANLALLILDTLLTNAIEATPRGGTVALEIASETQETMFRVRDAGGGIPESVRTGLFSPVRSSKPGGTGVGLAIAQRLAQHLGARLELVRTGADGSEFRLALQNSFDRTGRRDCHEANK